MEVINENKILTREGIFELIDQKYIQFTIHNHITTHRIDCLKENFEAVTTLSKGKKYDMLTFTESMDRLGDEEENLIREMFPKLFKSQTIVTNNKLSIMIINFALTIKKPPIPMKIFSTEEKALKWMFGN